MPPTRAFYSVVQYVPDPGRAEGANTGVLLYVPGTNWLQVKPSPTLARVKKFFKPTPIELTRIEQALTGLRHRLEEAEAFDSEKDLARFVSSRPDVVRLTPPRLVLVTDPAADLDKLYAELVGDPDLRTPPARAGRSLPPRLAEVFGKLEAECRVWRPDPITVPTVRRKFPVSAAYQNGSLNFVRTESVTAGRWADRLEKLSFNGMLIAEHGVNGQSAKLVVVSADPAAEPKTEARSRDALSEFGVDFVAYPEAGRFADKVELEAH